MGCSFSKQRQRLIGHHKQEEDPAAVLAVQTCFDICDIEALYELFKKLSSSIVDDGLISKEEFQLGLFGNSKKRNLFADRIFDLFDSGKDGVIEFGEFVRGLSVFHPAAPQPQKAAFAFRLHDIRQSGFIERDEVGNNKVLFCENIFIEKMILRTVREMIVALLSESQLVFSDDIIQLIIDKAFQEADLKGDGKIDPDEWQQFVARNPSLLRNMTIPHLKDLNKEFRNFELSPDFIEDDIRNL
ncbi:calcineurin B-like protein 7 isoform X1 [Arachis duranensis]|uniref:Calcineurin B-like protein n=1 Tax=Arachis duranensis TaxID=130453 RepID=A0A6P5NB48_ARADU|nr:calcineurin B-like protein 7 isoform X1 [Arachis duranensis]XP_057748340.1 calcineurin B-like protein 7 isoform X1 [Arachis stenosperma]XP_057748341.1 calcineurin B-like protein 7 isoform X1 [Arachis stenosperma]XP_057748342.1 calcineurin B-like protein 7 isoform X1 [Arachis stenosperma]XP_057748343.1 calcineurin B-like protein 7 isoform X1 [Arachis stenosperma]XP_057748344.1 calcineurin B-like protein 7 isoform X1 [Arachis stenosperma]XP_057748346.1 calcineurin B-like protein 7 isoform X1